MTTWDPFSRPGHLINRAARLFNRIGEARLRPLGFSPAQMPVLHMLGKGEACSQKELAQRAKIEQPTMAEMLARMQRDGIVVRKVDPSDRRGSLVSLSKPALKRIADLRDRVNHANDEAVEGLSEREIATLIKLMTRVVQNLEAMEARDAET